MDIQITIINKKVAEVLSGRIISKLLEKKEKFSVYK